MFRIARSLALATALAVSAGAAPVAQAQEQRGAVQPRQRDRERKAISAFAAGRYQDALEMYADLYADYHDPLYLRNIGRCHYKLKNLEKAITSFEDYLSKYKRITALETDEVQSWIKEMKDSLRPEPPPPEPAPPPPPPVQLTVKPEPVPPVNLVDRPPPRDDHHDRNVLLRKVGVGALIAGGALAVAGGAFMASSWSKHRSSKKECTTSCAADADSIDSRATLSKVLFISAGVVAAAGGAMIILFPVDHPRTGEAAGLGAASTFTF
jgi:hypothetical protein